MMITRELNSLYLAEIKLLNEKIKYIEEGNRRLQGIMEDCQRQKTKCEDDLQNVSSGNDEIVILKKELELYKTELEDEKKKNQKLEEDIEGFKSQISILKANEKTSSLFIAELWTEWTDCSKTCEGGLRTRTNKCTTYGKQTEDCKTYSCG